MKQLSPEEAARRFDSEPESVFISLSEILKKFDVTEDQFRREAAAGLIVCTGTAEHDDQGRLVGYLNVGASGAEIVRWMARTGHKLVGQA